MSFAIGAAAYATQRLASLFAQFTSPQAASTDTSSASMPATSDTTAPANNSLTGSAQPSLSGGILSMLMGLQDANGASPAPGGGMQSVFNAMDSDGDGSVSQSEMENFLGKAGVSQGQADAIYAKLNPSGDANGVSESQLASAVHQHRHHHHHAGSAAGNPADTLMALLDGNQDGSVSQDDFSSAVTAHGGTTAEAASDFTALDSDKSGTLSSAEFATAWQNIQGQQGGGAFVNTILDAFAKANNSAATAAASSVTA